MAMSEPGATTPDVVDLLKAQHEQVKALFARLKNLSGEAAQEPFDDLRRLLAVHETAEEEVVYPVLRRQGADDVVQARLAEEGDAKGVLADLEKKGPGAPTFASELAGFEKAVLSHAEAEEREVFPRLIKDVTSDERRKMGQAVLAAEAIAPTHPHPKGPESAIGNLIVGPFVAMVDRVRDAIQEHTRKAG
ncbi:MAG TPA: hemerythrin domain-containing protein [Acidimicrobiia bacterium]|nr:hemerythrin domain-containing protein [Acidimicrobiia bacterium]